MAQTVGMVAATVASKYGVNFHEGIDNVLDATEAMWGRTAPEHFTAVQVQDILEWVDRYYDTLRTNNIGVS